jgi:hypothetical protein
MRAYVGVDWSATEAVCAVAGEEGPPRPIRGPAKPTLGSVREIVERARSMTGADEVYVMIEGGATQWVWLFHTAGAVVQVVDPKQARRYAESQGSSGAKDDPRDAGSLADMCRSPSHRKPAWKPDSTELQRIDVLAIMHEQLTKDLGRAKQRVRDAVRKWMPQVERALPGDVGGRWIKRFLGKVPTPWHARTLKRAAFDRLVEGARMETRDRLWAALEETEAPWLSGELAQVIAVQVRHGLDQVELLRDQLQDIERRLDDVTRDTAARQIAESMDGVALLVCTAMLQYAFRDGPTDRDQASIRMGASPVFVGSGRTKKGRPKGTARMRRAAPSQARRMTYLMGRLASQRLDWARAMYADAMQRGQNPATAYRRIARCILRIQTAMLRTGQPYDNARYVAALKARGVRWAIELVAA